MSSKIEVTFWMFDGEKGTELLPRKFTVRHFRNYSKTLTGKMEVCPYGGYTVLSDCAGELYVAKCNPVYDKFSRSAGLREALKHYIERNYVGYNLIDVESSGINKFRVVLDLHHTSN